MSISSPLQESAAITIQHWWHKQQNIASKQFLGKIVSLEAVKAKSFQALLELLGDKSFEDAAGRLLGKTKRLFLSSLMIVSHPEHIFESQGEKEKELQASAEKALTLFIKTCQDLIDRKPRNSKEFQVAFSLFAEQNHAWRESDKERLLEVFIATYLRIEDRILYIGEYPNGKHRDFAAGFAAQQENLHGKIARLGGASALEKRVSTFRAEWTEKRLSRLVGAALNHEIAITPNFRFPYAPEVDVTLFATAIKENNFAVAVDLFHALGRALQQVRRNIESLELFSTAHLKELFEEAGSWQPIQGLFLHLLRSLRELEAQIDDAETDRWIRVTTQGGAESLSLAPDLAIYLFRTFNKVQVDRCNFHIQNRRSFIVHETIQEEKEEFDESLDHTRTFFNKLLKNRETLGLTPSMLFSSHAPVHLVNIGLADLLTEEAISLETLPETWLLDTKRLSHAHEEIRSLMQQYSAISIFRQILKNPSDDTVKEFQKHVEEFMKSPFSDKQLAKLTADYARREKPSLSEGEVRMIERVTFNSFLPDDPVYKATRTRFSQAIVGFLYQNNLYGEKLNNNNLRFFKEKLGTICYQLAFLAQFHLSVHEGRYKALLQTIRSDELQPLLRATQVPPLPEAYRIGANKFATAYTTIQKVVIATNALTFIRSAIWHQDESITAKTLTDAEIETLINENHLREGIINPNLPPAAFRQQVVMMAKKILPNVNVSAALFAKNKGFQLIRDHIIDLTEKQIKQGHLNDVPEHTLLKFFWEGIQTACKDWTLFLTEPERQFQGQETLPLPLIPEMRSGVRPPAKP